MSTAQTKTPPHQRTTRAVGWISSLFFANFFILLLITISLSQWIVPGWFLSVFFPIHSPPSAATALTLTPILFCLNLFLLRFSRRLPTLPTALRFPLRIYFASAFIAAFCFVFLVLCGVVWALLSFLVTLCGFFLPSAELHLSVQPVLTQGFQLFAGVSLMLITGLFIYGYLGGQRQLHISEIELPLAHWPATSPHLTIAHISDLHIGTNLTAQELKTYVQRVNELRPDLILLTGDILDSNPAYIPDFFPYLNALHARHGVFACLGNHDRYAGAQAVAAGLTDYTHITLLRDQVSHLAIADTTLHLIGLDDRGKDWARGLDADTTLTHLRADLPSQEPTILLSHRPDIFPAAASLGIDLTLSGHTHGGQFALPFQSHQFNLARFITRFPRGQYSLEDCFLYVNRGLGVTGQRIRLFTPREIALLTCRA